MISFLQQEIETQFKEGEKGVRTVLFSKLLFACIAHPAEYKLLPDDKDIRDKLLEEESAKAFEEVASRLEKVALGEGNAEETQIMNDICTALVVR